jgi:pimeloyl-ACP methyl ester carboxylesterase
MLPLLCLHGALATHHQFDPLRPHLSEHITLHAFNFEGHGDTPAPHRSLRAEHLVENVIAYLDEHNLTRVNIFGYSLGGYVACMVAKNHPDRVERVITLGTRYLWDEATLERELRMADPATMQAKVPRFVEALAQQHQAVGWEMVVGQTQNLLRANHETNGLTADYLATIAHPVRVMVGDRDSTAGVAESFAAFKALPNGQFEVLPGTPHPLQKVNMTRLAMSIQEFLQ